MKLLKYCSVVLLILAGSQLGYSQSNVPKELHVGDHLPYITLTGFYDDTLKRVSLSDLYQHKLLLLDFWGTWCGSCLAELPHYTLLKKEFGDRLQVLAVGYESYQKVHALFKRQPALNSGSYLVLTKDKILTRDLFPHKFLPHLVWIDETGKVIAITQGTDVTDLNIQNALAGKPINAREKKDDKLGLAVIFEPFHAMDTSFLNRSILTRKADGFPSFDGMQGVTQEEPTKGDRIFVGNETISDLYRYALFNNKISGHNFSRIVIETKDSLKYMVPKYAPFSFQKSNYKNYSDWEDQNLYCYELKMPSKIEDTILRNYMVSDLNRYLNLNGRYEERLLDCYILNYTDKVLAGKINPELSGLTSKKPQLNSWILTNVQELLGCLNELIDDGTIVNESGLSGKADLNINLTMKNGTSYEQMNSSLIPYGFHLVKGKRKIRVFVISER